MQAIVEVLFNVLSESETEDVPYVLDKLVERFPEEIMPLVIPLSQQLVLQFSALLDYDADEDSHKPFTAMVILTTLYRSFAPQYFDFPFPLFLFTRSFHLCVFPYK